MREKLMVNVFYSSNPNLDISHLRIPQIRCYHLIKTLLFPPLFMAALLLIITTTSKVQAQESVLVQGLRLSTLSEGEILPKDFFSACITLTMKYDSTFILYDFAECRHNSKNINLKNWWNGLQIDSLDAPEVSNLNVTDTFLLTLNDDISFFRDFKWINRFDHTMKQTNYFSRDTLTYIVELIENGTNNRLALLDSFAIQRKVPSGAPNFLGIHSPFKKINYTIPESMNGKTAYIKLSILVNGDGSLYPARKTGLAVGLSQLLTHPLKAEFREKFGVNANYKISTDELNTTYVNLTPNPSNRHIKISLHKSLPSHEDYYISVYSTEGKITNGLEKIAINPKRGFEFDINTKGLYILTLENNNGVVSRKKIIIN